MFVVHCQQLQLLHIHLLQERVQVDSLDQALNIAVQLLILLGKVCVLGPKSLVAASQLCQFRLLLLFLALQLRVLNLKTQQLLAVMSTFVLNYGGFFREKFHLLLCVNLRVQHISS